MPFPDWNEKVFERLFAMGMTARDVIMVCSTQHVRMNDFIRTDHGPDSVISSTPQGEF